jgi:hypothetical protein
MGFGQLPPSLFFANKVKPRETLTTRIEYNRISHFEQSLLPEAISGWECTPFTSTAFDRWWQEWSQHIFNEPITVHCSLLDTFKLHLRYDLIHLVFTILYSQDTLKHTFI